MTLMKSLNHEVYIGDNLDVMQDSDFLTKYQNAIHLIYIDPPYNTQTQKSYKDKNTSNDWVAFIHARLEAARRLMADDAVILISIDDNEFPHLRICCDGVFGSENFIGTFITKQAQRSNSKLINTVHEYVLCYAKNRKNIRKFIVHRTDIPEQKQMINDLQNEIKTIFKQQGRSAAEKTLTKRIKSICHEQNITWLRNYSQLDNKGRIFFAVDLSTPSTPRAVDIPSINLHLSPLPTRGWATDEHFIELAKKHRLNFKNGRPYAIKYLTESEDNVPSILNFYSRQGTHDLKRLGLQGIFDTPKPVEMLKYFIRMTNTSNSIILDFFAGSGSTGQAVYETNLEDGRNNKYILVQIPEIVSRKSTAYKKCQELGIKPSIDQILDYRLRSFLTQKGLSPDYQIILVPKKHSL